MTTGEAEEDLVIPPDVLEEVERVLDDEAERWTRAVLDKLADARREGDTGEPSAPRAVARAIIIAAGAERAGVAATVPVVWLVESESEPTSTSGRLCMFPGGGQQPGESLAETAIRETREETGLDIAVDGWLLDVDDAHSSRRYFVAHVIGGQVARRDADGGQRVRVQLVPVDLALARLSSHYDQAALRQALSMSDAHHD